MPTREEIDKMVKDQLIRLERKDPPNECLKCIFFYGSGEKKAKHMRAKCGINGRYTVTGKPPEWCELLKKEAKA